MTGFAILLGIMVVLIGLVFLVRPGPANPPRRQRRDGPGVMVIDDPLTTPGPAMFGFQSSDAMISVDDDRDEKFEPGGGDFGGAGATGSWDDGGDDGGSGGGDGSGDGGGD